MNSINTRTKIEHCSQCPYSGIMINQARLKDDGICSIFCKKLNSIVYDGVECRRIDKHNSGAVASVDVVPDNCPYNENCEARACDDLHIDEILKNAPKGIELFSPRVGVVKYNHIKDDGTLVFDFDLPDCDDGNAHYSRKTITFLPDGREYDGIGTCLLFPSALRNNWDEWQRVLFPQSIGSVIADSMEGLFIIVDDGVFADSTNTRLRFDTSVTKMRYASKEETDTFHRKLKRHCWKWNQHTHEMEKISRCESCGAMGTVRCMDMTDACNKYDERNNSIYVDKLRGIVINRSIANMLKAFNLNGQHYEYTVREFAKLVESQVKEHICDYIEKNMCEVRENPKELFKTIRKKLRLGL